MTERAAQGEKYPYNVPSTAQPNIKKQYLFFYFEFHQTSGSNCHLVRKRERMDKASHVTRQILNLPA
jgi:hypothetical protein